MMLSITGQRARVTEAYTQAYPDPLVLKKDEAVTVVAHDTQWPAYIWCTNAAGKGGWVPEHYLAVDGITARAKRDYSAQELSAAVGEHLILLDEEGGWFWAENAAGERGWIPAKLIEIRL